MCHSFLPVFNSMSDVFCVLQKSYARQMKLSCQPYVYYIYINNTLPPALAVHEIYCEIFGPPMITLNFYFNCYILLNTFHHFFCHNMQNIM